VISHSHTHTHTPSGALIYWQMMEKKTLFMGDLFINQIFNKSKSNLRSWYGDLIMKA